MIVSRLRLQLTDTNSLVFIRFRLRGRGGRLVYAYQKGRERERKLSALVSTNLALFQNHNCVYMVTTLRDLCGMEKGRKNGPSRVTPLLPRAQSSYDLSQEPFCAFS